LRLIREDRELSQCEQSKRANFSTKTVCLIERDEQSHCIVTFENIASALKVSMRYFFDNHEPKQVLHLNADQRPTIGSKSVQFRD
jgi:transcriptional regulator with XRE-family HTH domain